MESVERTSEESGAANVKLVGMGRIVEPCSNSTVMMDSTMMEMAYGTVKIQSVANERPAETTSYVTPYPNPSIFFCKDNLQPPQLPSFRR